MKREQAAVWRKRIVRWLPWAVAAAAVGAFLWHFLPRPIERVVTVDGRYRWEAAEAPLLREIVWEPAEMVTLDGQDHRPSDGGARMSAPPDRDAEQPAQDEVVEPLDEASHEAAGESPDAALALPDDVYDPSLTDGGATLYYTRGRAGEGADIYVARLVDGRWSAGEPLAINSPQDDVGAVLSADGEELYFASNRPGGEGGFDLYVARRQTGGVHGSGVGVQEAWSAPENLGPVVNTPAHEYDPALSPDGRFLYLASNRVVGDGQDHRPSDGGARMSAPPDAGEEPDAGAEQESRWRGTPRVLPGREHFDLYRSERAGGEGDRARWSEPEALLALNSGANEAGPAVSPTGTYLFFASDREDGRGGFDVYRARIAGDALVEVTNLGSSVNSAGNEMEPAVSPEGFVLYFSSDRAVETREPEDDDRGDSRLSSLDFRLAPPDRYAIYRAASHEVFREVAWDSARWSALSGIWWKALLLTFGLALLAAVVWVARGWMFEKVTVSRFLAASVLLHVLLLFLLTLVSVTRQIIHIAQGTPAVEGGHQPHADGRNPYTDMADIAAPAPSEPAAVPRQIAEQAALPVPPETRRPSVPLDAQPQIRPDHEVAFVPREEAAARQPTRPPVEMPPPEMEELLAELPREAVDLPEAVEEPAEMPIRAPEAVEPARDDAAPRIVPRIERQAAALDNREPNRIELAEPAALPEPNVPVEPEPSEPAPADAPAVAEAALAEQPIELSQAEMPVEETVEAPDAEAPRETPTVDAAPARQEHLAPIEVRPSPTALSELPALALAPPPDAPRAARATLPAETAEEATVEIGEQVDIAGLSEQTPAPETPAPAAVESERSEAESPQLAFRPTSAPSRPAAERLESVAVPPESIEEAAAEAVVEPRPERGPSARRALDALTPAAQEEEVELADGAAEPPELDPQRPVVASSPLEAAVDPAELLQRTAPAAELSVRDTDAATLAEAAADDELEPAPALQPAPAAAARPAIEAEAGEDLVAALDMPLVEEERADADSVELEGIELEIARLDVAPLVATVPSEREFGGARGSLAARLELGTPAEIAVDAPLELGPLASRLERPRAAGSPIAYAQDDVGMTMMFTLRRAETRGEYVEIFGGSDASEAAVNRGLQWLAAHQNEDGSWSLHAFHHNCERLGHAHCSGAGSSNSDTAATGFALLPFLAAGHTHRAGDYQEVVRRGIEWLCAHQGESGDLFTATGNDHMYSHGIAAIALCEAYGLTEDPALREPAQRALDFIVAAQHPVSGGWRYQPGEEGDTSVVGWQVMALKSGEMARLIVPASASELALRWLERVEGNQPVGGLYGYQGPSPSPAMTAEGLLCRQFLGMQRGDAAMRAGADYLLQNLPNSGQASSYYWYYATQVMYHMQGEYWDRWNAVMRDQLVATQITEGPMAGTWEPAGDQWADRGGRLYTTALRLLILEVYYRHLPLYRQLEE